jgi:xylulokinase
MSRGSSGGASRRHGRSGGGARSELWCQVHADVLGRVVRQAADPVLASARGAALQASVALGIWAGTRWRRRCRSPGAFEPDPARRGVYDALFPEFVNLYKSTRKLYARLNGRR